MFECLSSYNPLTPGGRPFPDPPTGSGNRRTDFKFASFFVIDFCLLFLGVFSGLGVFFLALLVCKFGVFGGLFACLNFLIFFYCFSIHFWSFSTLKNKHFVRDVFQISRVARVLPSFPFATVFVTDFRAKFGSFWGSASLRWECFFLCGSLCVFGLFLALRMSPKMDLRFSAKRLLLHTALWMTAWTVF